MRRVEKAISLISKMNKKDLKIVDSAMRERWSYLVSLNCLDFQVGDKVTFKGKYGEQMKGKILSVARKSLRVEDENGKSWRISPSLLKKIKK